MSVVGIGTPKFFTASGAVTPPNLDTVQRIVLTTGAGVCQLNLRDGSSATGAIRTTLRTSASATIGFDLGAKFAGGVYVEMIAGTPELTLVMS